MPSYNPPVAVKSASFVKGVQAAGVTAARGIATLAQTVAAAISLIDC